MDAAILFLVFNRPTTTNLVFNAIRNVKPPRLYIAADGPRKGNLNDTFLTSEVREIVNKIDWDCKLYTLFRDENLGCKFAVSSAIDWFFLYESEGIILEDDVLPLSSFFEFCSEMLNKYRDNEKISLITGSNLISNYCSAEQSYFYSNYPNIWGWATWRRFWNNYDVNMEDWIIWKQSEQFKKLANGYPWFNFYWTDQLNAVFNNKVDTWDFQLFFTHWKLQNYCIVSSNNLTTNLGFDEFATHTSGQVPKCVSESIPKDLEFPLIYPKNFAVNYKMDSLINQYVFKINLITTLLWKLRRVKFLGNLLSQARKKARSKKLFFKSLFISTIA